VDEKYDLVVIGAGPAGDTAATLASYFGYRAVIIERNKPGGIVTTTGGVPTKTLREAVLYHTGFRDRGIYDDTLKPSSDTILLQAQKRTQQVCTYLQNTIASNLAANNIDYVQGSARLVSKNTVEVICANAITRSFTAPVVIIATGSRPLHPKTVYFDDPDIYDSDRIFSLDRIPQDLLVIGGGPSGIEFAAIFASLGIPVAINDIRERLLTMMDGEMSEMMAQYLSQVGVNLILGTQVKDIHRKDGKFHVRFDNEKTFSSEKILVATGRIANTENLGLEEVGIHLNDCGWIVTDDAFRTTIPNIYAIGDVIGPIRASVAMEQGRRVVHHAFNIPLSELPDTNPSIAVYGTIEVASAGLTEEQCRSQGIVYGIGRSNLTDTPNGAIAGHTGLLKLIYRQSDRRLLGVHCIGNTASEVVGIGQAVMHFHGTLSDINAMTLNTPTYGYAYKYAALDGMKRFINSFIQHLVEKGA
jgi:NAD(P) transhydrogenase